MADIKIPTPPSTQSAPSESEAKSMVSPSTVSDIPSTVSEDADCVKPTVPDKSAVVSTIKESEDMITAVESVAAMYGIPASHVLEDDSSNSIRVVEDNIIVPSSSNSKPSENGKAIIQSIGAVLDYISQRADEKLNDFQAKHIEMSRLKDHLKNDANPAKGKVVSRHVDANGEEILVYDSGLVDLPNTNAGQAKVDELRAQGAIPEHNYDPEGWMKKQTSSYFTDADDITQGTDLGNTNTPDVSVDMGNGSTETMSLADTSEPQTTDVASAVQESYDVLHSISRYNNTRHLGYDILREQGFKFVKPIDFFQESAAKKKNKATTALGIEHMKFDNTNLLKAIKYMNEARAEQKGAAKGRLNIEQLINHPRYQKAIDCLNKQFDARLNIRFFKVKDHPNQAYTSIWNDIKTHLTISKSKGFQLGGLPVDIFIVNTALDEDAPDDISLFGQSVISVMCHEIFHNIMAVLKCNQSQFTASLAATMSIAQDVPSARNRRKLMTNFVDTLDEFNGMKLNPLTRRALVKHLTYLSTIAHDDKALREYEAAIKSKDGIRTIDDQIHRMEKRVRSMKVRTYGPGRYVVPAILTIASFVAMALGPVEIIALTGTLFGAAVGNVVGTAAVHAVEIDAIKKVKNGTIKNLEEHWCDMFAAMYNLPVTFFLVGNPRKGASNDISLEQLKRYDELEREAMALMMGKYPTISERNQAAVKYAKKTLDGKYKLDPSIKKYLEWIVANYSKNLSLDIDTIYSKGTFDPKTAEDLDKHIESLIGSANIKITEYDLSWLNTSEEDIF